MLYFSPKSRETAGLMGARAGDWPKGTFPLTLGAPGVTVMTEGEDVDMLDCILLRPVPETPRLVP